jgi:hypothetical protein
MLVHDGSWSGNRKEPYKVVITEMFFTLVTNRVIRLFTALFWFGEAWKETRLQPKIVNFSNCVESLFSTGDREGISETIAERLAWLSFPADADRSERRKTFDDMRKVYGARCKAVHGDAAVHNLPLPLLAHKAEELAALGIFACTQLPPFFRREQNEKHLRERLNEFFVRLRLEGLERGLVFLEESAKDEN